MIYTVTLNPALDKTVVIPHFRTDTVNRVTNVRMDPGGKGINVSKVLAELGEPSVAFGFAGGTAGQTLRRMLAERGLESELYEADGETRTNLKIIDPASHTNTDVKNPARRFPPQRWKNCCAAFWRASPRAILSSFPAVCRPGLRPIPTAAGPSAAGRRARAFSWMRTGRRLRAGCRPGRI